MVRFPNPHAAKKTLTIPGFLSAECARAEIEGLGKQCLFRILPSELLAIRGESEAWSDYPSAYSHIVLRALSSGTRMVRERDLMNWVFASSPRYGVVIDAAMTDHIFSLFRLCLKAIVREALSLDGDQNNGCPVLVQALIWFASQLSILYGETNGKLFAIDMLKQCISEAAARGLMMTESPPTLIEEGSHSQNELNRTVTGEVISVSQVVAAVAALHERAFFEEKTRGFRVSQPLTMAEHDYVSQIADEERKRRPNYRPIIEHDGLHRQRSSYQEANKTKTREELLAEERDYKRRRMSYRGKKGKRTTLQVTRDIIEGYMVEIKKAGGIGCFVKGTEDGGMFLSESPSAQDITTSVDEPIGSSYAGNGGSQYNNRTHSHSDYIKRSKSFKDASPKDYEQPRRSLHEHHVNVDQRMVSQSKNDRGNYSRSPERYKSRGRSHVRSSHLLEHDDLEVTRIQHREIRQPSSGMSRYDNSRSSSSVSNSVNDISVRKGEQKSKVEHRRPRNRYETVSSDFLGQNAFEDRYNPSESLDMYEDDLSTGVKGVRQDKLCLREFNDQPSGYSAGRHYHDYLDKSE